VAAEIVAIIVSGKAVDNGFLKKRRAPQQLLFVALAPARERLVVRKEPYGAAAFPSN